MSAPRAVLCPLCRSSSQPKDAFCLYMEVHCPICFEKVDQAICLPCGHAVCNDDFQNLGGSRRLHHRRAQSIPARPVPQEVLADQAAAGAYHTAAGLSFVAAASSAITTIGGAASLITPMAAVVAAGIGGLAAAGMINDEHQTEISSSGDLSQKPTVVRSLIGAAAVTAAASSLNACAAAQVASDALAAAAMAEAYAASITGVIACLSGAQAAAQAQAAFATTTAVAASSTATITAATSSVVVPVAAAVVGWGLYKLNQD
jgi:hypothetical protein